MVFYFFATKNPGYLSRLKIPDIETSENFISDIEFNFIELPKFNKKEDELTSIIVQWVYFIKNAEDLQIIPESVKDQGLKNAYEDADRHNWTKEELEEYDKVFMREQDDRGRVSFALRTGITKVQKDIARNLFKPGLSNADISKSTGLTLSGVIKLKDEK